MGSVFLLIIPIREGKPQRGTTETPKRQGRHTPPGKHIATLIFGVLRIGNFVHHETRLQVGCNDSQTSGNSKQPIMLLLSFAKYIDQTKCLGENWHNHIMNTKIQHFVFLTNDIWAIPTQATGSKRSVDSSTFADTEGYVASKRFKHHRFAVAVFIVLLLNISNIFKYRDLQSFQGFPSTSISV